MASHQAPDHLLHWDCNTLKSLVQQCECNCNHGFHLCLSRLECWSPCSSWNSVEVTCKFKKVLNRLNPFTVPFTRKLADGSRCLLSEGVISWWSSACTVAPGNSEVHRTLKFSPENCCTMLHAAQLLFPNEPEPVCRSTAKKVSHCFFYVFFTFQEIGMPVHQFVFAWHKAKHRDKSKISTSNINTLIKHCH